jgi:hypothetical protein
MTCGNYLCHRQSAAARAIRLGGALAVFLAAVGGLALPAVTSNRPITPVTQGPYGECKCAIKKCEMFLKSANKQIY